ncbi:MAG: MFS transporter, partial [Candidatus Heimdallarchaeota archaeon]|nr:MFS transporter [Candidatus Heimdallarchaeota archaeon]
TILIGDLYLGTERKQVNGIVTSIGSAAGIIGPIISGILASIDWRISFFAFSFGFIPLLLVITSLKLPENAIQEKPSNRPNFKDILSSIKDGVRLMKTRGLNIIFMVCLLVYGIDAGIMFTYYPIYVEQVFGVTQIDIGFSMACLFGASTISGLIYGAVARHLSSRTVGIIAITLYAVGVIAIPFQTSFLATLIPLFAAGFGFGFLMPLLINELLDYTPEKIRGTEISLYFAVLRLGQTVLPVLFAGVLALSGSMTNLFLVAGIFGFLFIGVYAIENTYLHTHGILVDSTITTSKPLTSDKTSTNQKLE